MNQFFFFQAEDGIRDGHVTGVQTCALPISGWNVNNESFMKPLTDNGIINNLKIRFSYGKIGNENVAPYLWEEIVKIGRASCRERVYLLEAAGYRREKIR